MISNIRSLGAVPLASAVDGGAVVRPVAAPHLFCRARNPLPAARQAREELPPTDRLAGHPLRFARAGSLDPAVLVRGAAAFGRANRGTPNHSQVPARNIFSGHVNPLLSVNISQNVGFPQKDRISRANGAARVPACLTAPGVHPHD